MTARQAIIERLRRHAKALNKRSFDMTAKYNGIPRAEAARIWNEAQ